MSCEYDVAGVPIKHLSDERKRIMNELTRDPIDPKELLCYLRPTIKAIDSAMERKDARKANRREAASY